MSVNSVPVQINSTCFGRQNTGLLLLLAGCRRLLSFIPRFQSRCKHFQEPWNELELADKDALRVYTCIYNCVIEARCYLKASVDSCQHNLRHF